MKTRLIAFIVAIYTGIVIGLAQQQSEPKTIPVKVSTNATTDSTFQLIIKEIPGHPVTDTIYGQYGSGQNMPFGGAGDLLKGNIIENNPDLKDLIESQVLTLSRDTTKGIIFSIKKDKAPENLNIRLNGAYFKDNKNGWCPDTKIVYKIIWTIPINRHGQLPNQKNIDDYNKEHNSVQQYDTEKNKDADVESKEGDGESKWTFSYVDLILFLLIVILLVYTSYLASKLKHIQTRKEDGVVGNHDETIEELMTRSKRQIDSIIALTHQYREVNEELKGQKSIIHRLDDRMKKIQKSVDSSQKKEQDKTPIVEKPLPSMRNIGFAQPVIGQNSLELTDGEAAFFEIKEYPDGSLKFFLRNVPELLTFFESNASMLEIFKSCGIIRFNEIPANSHVKVKTPGILMKVDNGRYVVTTPLVLSFEN